MKIDDVILAMALKRSVKYRGKSAAVLSMDSRTQRVLIHVKGGETKMVDYDELKQE